MTLHDVVASWQPEWCCAPIYRHGVNWLDRNKRQHTSDGKHPWPRSRYETVEPWRAAQMVGADFGAIGIWFGPRSRGLVCVDVDGGLSEFERVHPEIYGTAHIRSPKKDRVKLLYVVPEELWDDVKGFDCKNDSFEFQVLWTDKQAVCAGAYKNEGYYTYVPVNGAQQAPAWLLEQMMQKAAKRKSAGEKLADRFDTHEQAVQKISDWLSVIPHEGEWLDGEELTVEGWWFKVGACIAGAGIGEDGLALWSEWSQKDTRYKEDWQNGNPCADRWADFTVDGAGPGSLCKLADKFDPDRERLSSEVKQQIEIKKVKESNVMDSHDKLIAALRAAMELENPSKIQHRLNELAAANNYRDGAAISKILTSHNEYEAGSDEITLDELLDSEDELFDFAIPELLPSPGTVLIHGRGGSGKTMCLLNLAMHISRGMPFKVRGANVPVERGRVVWMNADQNQKRIKRQMKEVGFQKGDDFVLINGASLLWPAWLEKTLKKHQPTLVVWDSVTACMRGSVVDQNRAEYSDPLYQITCGNGTFYPEATHVFIHHSNKEGQSRGTSSLEDAVDIVWDIRKPNEKEVEELGQSRVITIGKSREGDEGKQYHLQQKPDYTYQLIDPADERGERQSTEDQLLVCMRHRREWLKADAVKKLPCSGSDTVKLTALTRLADKGLVERRGTKRNYEYRALISDPSPLSPPERASLISRDSSAGLGSSRWKR